MVESADEMHNRKKHIRFGKKGMPKRANSIDC